MKINDEGIRLIKSFEGFHTKPYQLNGEQYYTVGWGHYGKDVIPNKIYSLDECERLFKEDLYRFVINVDKYSDKYDFNENEFSALVSFAYNIGSVDVLLNWGKRTRDEIRIKIPQYCRDSTGTILEGLHRRRIKELELFNKPVESSDELFDTIEIK